MTDAKGSDNRKRAAALADELSEIVEHLLANGCLGLTTKIDTADFVVIVSALRAYADQPAAPGCLVEVVAAGIADVQIPGGMRHDEYCGADGLRMVAAAALPAINAAGYVIMPREPTEAMIEAAWLASSAWGVGEAAGQWFVSDTHSGGSTVEMIGSRDGAVAEMNMRNTTASIRAALSAGAGHEA